MNANEWNKAPEPSWAFSGLTQKQTSYATHGYHRYPAKFIPQLAARLIQEYSAEGDLVIDPFMGSGTTLVEAKLNVRPSIGVDIHPVAHLITRAKTSVIPPEKLERAIEKINIRLSKPEQPSLFGETEHSAKPDTANKQRLCYWFPESALVELAQIQNAIDALEHENERTFFYCALSHCLKAVSYWHDRSIKPMRKLDKTIPSAHKVFLRHIQRMRNGNCEFWELLNQKKALGTPAVAYCADARQLPVEDGSATLIITSPPYVTSYEYADLHQLSTLWFGWTDNFDEFRKQFIGTSRNIQNATSEPSSALAKQITEQIGETSPRQAQSVAHYFTEMHACFCEMRRVLKLGGYVCIVIGNTNLRGVEVQNAQVFAEELELLGFDIERVIVREIPSKILPSTRDKATGKFAKAEAANHRAYPTEYVLIARKR